MITWKECGTDEFTSEDGRFHILKMYDWLFEGSHWMLIDNRQKGRKAARYHLQTQEECRAMAETLIGRKNI